MASQGTIPNHARAPFVMPRGQPGESSDPAATRAWTLWLAPLACGLGYHCTFFPLAWGNLAWFALVPLLLLVRLPGRPRRLYLAATLGGLVCYLPALLWMPVADSRMYATWALVSLYLASYFPLAVALLRWIERRTTLPLTVS